jgi:ABC-type transport system substrate-binding protein
MRHFSEIGLKPWRIFLPTLSLLLALAVACGSAAPPEPVVEERAGEKKAEVVEEVEKVVVATPAPAPAQPEAEVNPGKLTIMVGDLSNERFDPLFAVGGHGGQTYGKIVHGSLISTDERLRPLPGIASDWGLSADGLTWTFTIREGVKFHDGSELTPEDVLWTLQHYFGPQAVEYTNQSNAAVVSRATDRVELRGPDEVSLTTKTPVTQIGILVGEAASNWFPVLPKRATLHDEAEELAYDNNPIGAGFMKLTEYTPAQVMKFERFDDFYYHPENGFPEDKRVNFQSLDLFLVPEEATRVAALRAGEADIVPASLATREQVEAGGGRLVFGQEGVALEARWIGCWEPQLPCHDKRVRQALDYAIDKEVIRDRLYGGPEVLYLKGWVGATPSAIGYTDALNPRPFDPTKARQLLAEAGYKTPDNPSGKDFGKLILNTWADTAAPLQVEGAQLAADVWKRELGLDVEVRVADETGIKTHWYAGELNGQMMWRSDETRPDSSAWLNTAYGDTTTRNRRHEDPVLVRTVLDTIEILDPDKRAESMEQLLLRLQDESYQLALGYVNIPWAVGPRVLTWQPYSMSGWVTALHTVTLK